MSRRTINYDPALRKTPVGQKIYKAWRNIRTHQYVPEWEEFQDFYAWAVKTGGDRIGTRLACIDPEKPYGPDNCKWNGGKKTEAYYGRPDGELAASIKRFDRTVARIRRAYGLPPLKGASK